MDIREKIESAIDSELVEYGNEYNWLEIECSDNPNKWTKEIIKVRQVFVKSILDLIHGEIESAIPKEKDVMYSGLDVYKHQQVVCLDKVSDWGKKVGYNQALSDIRTALQRKGLI